MLTTSSASKSAEEFSGSRQACTCNPGNVAYLDVEWMTISGPSFAWTGDTLALAEQFWNQSVPDGKPRPTWRDLLQLTDRHGRGEKYREVLSYPREVGFAVMPNPDGATARPQGPTQVTDREDVRMGQPQWNRPTYADSLRRGVLQPPTTDRPKRALSVGFGGSSPPTRFQESKRYRQREEVQWIRPH